MKQLLESLVGKTTPELSSKNFGVTAVTIYMYGSVNVSNGAFSKTIEFNVSLSGTYFGKDVISIDDWEIQDYYDTMLGEIPVDDVRQLRETLNGSGLSTLAKALDLDNKQIAKLLAKGVEESKEFKGLYGKNAIVFDALTEEEQEVYRLQHVIDNYDDTSINHFNIKKYLEVEETEDEEGNKVETKVKPSLEKLKEVLKDLKKK